MALKFMADKKEDELTSTREICDNFSTPFDTTAKVMQTMNNYGILSSVKGIKGGYILAKSLDDLTFFELVQVIENRKLGSPCTNAKGSLCELVKNCNIIGPLEELNQQLNNFLSALSIQNILFNQHEVTFTSQVNSWTMKIY